MIPGAHLGGGREGGRREIHPLPSNSKLSLNKAFAPNMPHKGPKCPKMTCTSIQIPCPALTLDAPLDT